MNMQYNCLWPKIFIFVQCTEIYSAPSHENLNKNILSWLEVARKQNLHDYCG